MLAGVLSSLLELDKEMMSSSTESSSFVDDCSVCNEEDELCISSWGVCFEDSVANSFSSNLYHSGLRRDKVKYI